MLSSVVAEVFEPDAICFPIITTVSQHNAVAKARRLSMIEHDEDKGRRIEKPHLGKLIPQQRSPLLPRRLGVYARIVRGTTKRPPILLGAPCRVTDTG